MVNFLLNVEDCFYTTTGSEGYNFGAVRLEPYLSANIGQI